MVSPLPGKYARTPPPPACPARRTPAQHTPGPAPAPAPPGPALRPGPHGPARPGPARAEPADAPGQRGLGAGSGPACTARRGQICMDTPTPRSRAASAAPAARSHCPAPHRPLRAPPPRPPNRLPVPIRVPVPVPVSMPELPHRPPAPPAARPPSTRPDPPRPRHRPAPRCAPARTARPGPARAEPADAPGQRGLGAGSGPACTARWGQICMDTPTSQHGTLPCPAVICMATPPSPGAPSGQRSLAARRSAPPSPPLPGRVGIVPNGTGPGTDPEPERIQNGPAERGRGQREPREEPRCGAEAPGGARQQRAVPGERQLRQREMAAPSPGPRREQSPARARPGAAAPRLSGLPAGPGRGGSGGAGPEGAPVYPCKFSAISAVLGAFGLGPPLHVAAPSLSLHEQTRIRPGVPRQCPPGGTGASPLSPRCFPAHADTAGTARGPSPLRGGRPEPPLGDPLASSCGQRSNLRHQRVRLYQSRKGSVPEATSGRRSRKYARIPPPPACPARRTPAQHTPGPAPAPAPPGPALRPGPHGPARPAPSPRTRQDSAGRGGSAGGSAMTVDTPPP
ncbi:basic proline-rich protein-like [Molothrus ater]|uniref:basic proline-rich protein-like n=1 Tax=Molothrus ater TaxID=84834 RepID=UPI00174D9697|nr:basic proline-rich protein-like [Molothrus ater]